MGGGNGCKSAAKREKNAAKMAKVKGSQLGAVKAQPMRICKKVGQRRTQRAQARSR